MPPGYVLRRPGTCQKLPLSKPDPRTDLSRTIRVDSTQDVQECVQLQRLDEVVIDARFPSHSRSSSRP